MSMDDDSARESFVSWRFVKELSSVAMKTKRFRSETTVVGFQDQVPIEKTTQGRLNECQIEQ